MTNKIRFKIPIKSLEIGSLWGLGETAVAGRHHRVPELHQHALDGVVAVPPGHSGEVRSHMTRALVHGGEVDAGEEAHLGGPQGVVGAAVDSQLIQPVLIRGLVA